MSTKPQESQQIPWLKLAVAIAIIRNKPAHLSASEYAAHLQAEFLTSQSLLQDRYYQARMQILQLQQKLAISSLQDMELNREALSLSQEVVNSQSQQNLPGCPQSNSSAPGNSDLFTPPPSGETVASLSNFTVSACLPQIRNHTLSSLAVASDQTAGGRASLTDNVMVASIDTGEGCSQACLLDNSRFIYSMISLQSLTAKGPSIQTMETAKVHVHTMSDVINRDAVVLSESCLCKAAESVKLVLDKFHWLEDRPEFMQEVCQLVERIISKLVHPSEIGQYPAHRQKHSLMKMLLVFMRGSSKPLLSSILDSLIESWETFCHTLRSSQRSGKPVEADVFENGYFLVRCLELIMQMWVKDCPLHPDTLHDTQTRLDNSLLHVTDRFPLVAQAVWRVTALIEIILQNR